MSDEKIIDDMISSVKKIERESSDDKYIVGGGSKKNTAVTKIISKLEETIENEDKQN